MSSATVGVDHKLCAGHGVCALLLPERVTLDPWGFPVVDATPVEGRAVRKAGRAARACPRRALLVDVQPAARSGTSVAS